MQLRRALRKGIIAYIDKWLEDHPEAWFISSQEVTKILDMVSSEFTHRHHAERSKNERGEYR